jgi:hypothetical protein
VPKAVRKSASRRAAERAAAEQDGTAQPRFDLRA